MILLCGLIGTDSFGGPYGPPAGEANSTAIHMDDPNFAAWATAATVERGYADISNPSVGYASFGSDANVIGKATGDAFGVLSLGDGGLVILTFANPITNGPGYDFAVFENSFSDTFLELGFVEVSSNGEHFFRFDAVSLTPTDTQVNGFGSIDVTDLHNFAGKYRMGYGTGFDLEELKNTSSLLDVTRITHVRIIDVVGSIEISYRSYDSQGHKVNDPWPTPYDASGLDLDAVGVIHERTLSGDIDGNGIVDLRDYIIFSAAYSTGPGDGNWSGHCDIFDPADDMVDMADLGTFINQWLYTEQWFEQ